MKSLWERAVSKNISLKGFLRGEIVKKTLRDADRPVFSDQVNQNLGMGSKQHCFAFFFSFWPCCVACGILVPQPGIEPRAPAVKVLSTNHWTAREFPTLFFKLFLKF